MLPSYTDTIALYVKRSKPAPAGTGAGFKHRTELGGLVGITLGLQLGDLAPQPLDLQLIGLHLAMAGLNGIGAELLLPNCAARSHG